MDSTSYQDLICYAEPQIQLSLESRNSLVGVYQTLCQNIETQSFQINYQLNDLPSDDGPRPVFDENFTPQNYFMDGTVLVEMVNITTMSSTVNIEMCLFSTTYEYSDFLRAGMKWKNYTKNATCNKVVVKNGENHTISFNISKPTFVFLGMATTDPVQIDQINITATGRDISNLGKNSTKVCQLSGEDMTCSVTLLNNQLLNSQSICIVAYEEGNPDGTYDYSNLTISLPNQVKHDNPYKLMLTVYGSVSLGVIATIILTLLMFPAIIWIWRKLLNRKKQAATTGQCSVNTAEVTCCPVEDTNRPQPKERPLMSYTGSDQLQQAIHQYHHNVEEGTPVNQGAASHHSDSSSPIPTTDLPQSLSKEESLVHGAGTRTDQNHSPKDSDQ